MGGGFVGPTEDGLPHQKYRRGEHQKDRHNKPHLSAAELELEQPPQEAEAEYQRNCHCAPKELTEFIKGLKNRLTEYSGKYPSECRLIDDDGNGCLTFEVSKGRFGFKLTAPYDETRRKAASELAKKNLELNYIVSTDIREHITNQGIAF